VVPVVVETLLAVELRDARDARVGLHRDAHLLDEGGDGEGHVLLAPALLVVLPHSMSTVPFCTSGMRFCEVTGWYLMSSLAAGPALLDVGQHALADLDVEAGELAVAQRVRQRARRFAHAHRDRPRFP
jgi:hypothetical protein